MKRDQPEKRSNEGYNFFMRTDLSPAKNLKKSKQREKVDMGPQPSIKIKRRRNTAREERKGSRLPVCKSGEVRV